jgi:hypothetical protein
MRSLPAGEVGPVLCWALAALRWLMVAFWQSRSLASADMLCFSCPQGRAGKTGWTGELGWAPLFMGENISFFSVTGG